MEAHRVMNRLPHFPAAPYWLPVGLLGSGGAPDEDGDEFRGIVAHDGGNVSVDAGGKCDGGPCVPESVQGDQRHRLPVNPTF